VLDTDLRQASVSPFSFPTSILDGRARA
jgi:hypothetical protein